MNRRRIVLVAGALVLATLVLAPLALRQIPFFRIRQVEVVGARYLAPGRVVAALGLAEDQHLFDPLGKARERLEQMPGIVSVSLNRRLPGTLQVTVIERTPAALISGADGMVALGCDGEALPYDPAAVPLDLPLVAKGDTVLVQALCLVRTTDSALYQDVQLARAWGAAAVALDLGPLRVLLRRAPTTDEIVAVGAVRRHLATSSREVAEIDARFAGWVIVRPERL